jgi:hypothetical protein
VPNGLFYTLNKIYPLIAVNIKKKQKKTDHQHFVKMHFEFILVDRFRPEMVIIRTQDTFLIIKLFGKIDFLPTDSISKSEVTGNKHIIFFGLVCNN